MKQQHDVFLYSPSDIVNFLACRPLTAVDLINLRSPLPAAKEGATAKLLQDKGFAHESAFLKRLRAEGRSIVEIPSGKPLEERARLTVEAVKSGADVVFQAAFLRQPWVGYADFLVRCPTPSDLGDYSYEVFDTKLARQVAPRFLVQLAFYNDLLATIQGRLGHKVHVVLGDGSIKSFCASEMDGYLAMIKERFLAHAASLRGVSTLEDVWHHPTLPYPVPCENCAKCRWADLCEDKRLADDHLSQVANIRKTHIARLEAAGITTLKKLGSIHASTMRIPGLDKTILRKLAHQAALQVSEKTSGKQEYALLPPFDTSTRPASAERVGMMLLPIASSGDLFFDMEGDPLEDGGLEYLFGVAFNSNGRTEFKPFWGHTREGEKSAFEEFVDFAIARIARFPDAHIYHYASYEVSAMRRLASRHSTRETEIDDLLREERFIDLYRVVRESLLISKDSYSIKKVESFYRPKRAGEVKKADESIAVYEEWRISQDPVLLKSIEDYNRDDCISTLQLRDWLQAIAPSWIPARAPAAAAAVEVLVAPPRQRSDKSIQAEAERLALEQRLLAMANGKQASKIADSSVFSLVAQMLAFYVREKKPMWWSLFDRQGAELEELLSDEDVIAACETENVTETNGGLSVRFRFPGQDFRLKAGDSVKTLKALKDGKVAAIDEAHKLVTVTFSQKIELNRIEHLVQCSDISTTTLSKAVIRFALSLLEKKAKYKALLDYLNRRPPDILGVKTGQDLLGGEPATLNNIWNVVSRMNDTTLYIQGPPGAGKTYTGAHLISRLVKTGKKVAICSNSHKAINHLMQAAHDLLQDCGHHHVAIKKVTKEEHKINRPGITHVVDGKKMISALSSMNLAGGVAWTFCTEGLDQAFDFLFVDEAGQVSLANLIAIGVCARNIVLLGDQMQLGQPIQASHPGRSGDSSLDYLLDGQATIEPHRGIFLDKTFRMHPDLCRFVSECFYEGRLLPDARTAKQRLVLSSRHHPALKNAGVVLHAVDHRGNGQRSTEEAAEINALLTDLLKQRYVDHEGRESPLTLDDVLIVAPYNAQVGLLTKVLPSGSRVGTVDKFQGQEAQVVIVSMTSSTTDDSPRGMGFLLDRNRLNVAVSRAKCLSIIVCSPSLLESTARTAEDIARLNVLGHAQRGAR